MSDDLSHLAVCPQAFAAPVESHTYCTQCFDYNATEYLPVCLQCVKQLVASCDQDQLTTNTNTTAQGQSTTPAVLNILQEAILPPNLSNTQFPSTNLCHNLNNCLDKSGIQEPTTALTIPGPAVHDWVICNPTTDAANETPAPQAAAMTDVLQTMTISEMSRGSTFASETQLVTCVDAHEGTRTIMTTPAQETSVEPLLQGSMVTPVVNESVTIIGLPEVELVYNGTEYVEDDALKRAYEEATLLYQRKEQEEISCESDVATNE